MRRIAPPSVLAALVLWATAAAAAAQAAEEPGELRLEGPRVVATGAAIRVAGEGAVAGERIAVERRIGARWLRVAGATADEHGRFEARHRPRRLQRRYVLRAVARDGRASRALRIRSRDVTLLAVGDVNLGDGPLHVMRQRGYRYPWTAVAPVLRRADIAFGNLECAVSRRGRRVPKEFSFRGPPRALREMGRYAGFDVLNLANNHVGDFGIPALLDTIRHVRGYGMTPVGAGRDLAAASRAAVVTRHGLRVAFVGFSNILPASFFATPGRAGTQPATISGIRAAVRRARRRADVVIATFHWGVERAHREDARQRAFAGAAIGAGAHAVIGAHPHVLQPIRRRGNRLMAYSLGNFVFGAGSPGTSRTGILSLRLSTRGVEGSRLIPARIVGTRPRL